MSRRYRECSIKRPRRTREDMIAIKDATKGVLRDDHPQTVRQVFYQLVTRGVIEKTEKDYQNVVIRLLTEMRETGDVPFEWIVDSTSGIFSLATAGRCPRVGERSARSAWPAPRRRASFRCGRFRARRQRRARGIARRGRSKSRLGTSKSAPFFSDRAVSSR